MVCKELNYTGGRALAMGSFGPGQGTVYNARFSCTGQEPSILLCAGLTNEMEKRRVCDLPYMARICQRYLESTPSVCKNHQNDAAIQCYMSGNDTSISRGLG